MTKKKPTLTEQVKELREEVTQLAQVVNHPDPRLELHHSVRIAGISGRLFAVERAIAQRPIQPKSCCHNFITTLSFCDKYVSDQRMLRAHHKCQHCGALQSDYV